MNQTIHTIFKIDPKLDLAGYEQIKSHIQDIDWEAFIPPKDPEEAAEILKKYHTDNAALLRDITNRTASLWHKKEQSFVDLSSIYFSPSDFPNDTYTLYPTIWPLVARNPQERTVAFPIRTNESDACAVIAHEFLHELFFHHIYNTFGNTVDLNSDTLYDLSEVFNVLVLEDDEWQKEFPFNVKPYTRHIALYTKLLPEWLQHKNIDALIKTALA